MPRTFLAATAVLALLLLGAAPAVAEPPLRLDDQITDRAGVGLDAEVPLALDRLRADEDIQLFVVFVDSFDGASGQEWADESARLSQLGSRDMLFAVAVRDRAYGYSVDAAFPRSGSEIDRLIASDVEPRLAVDDWSGATVALADGLRGGGIGIGAIAGLVAGAALVGGGVFLLSRRRRQSGPRPAPAGEQGP
ncbi:MAG TPA: TPM domain-containing protein, partial [Pseudonocardia sp.]|nr:TPM domain-containing protein [Pseudonocardia sp.]